MAIQGHILVVDDDPDIREIVAEILVQEGFVVDTAHDAFAAMGMLRTMRPDLVLSDIEMPGMDGIELFQRTRSADGTAPSPTILMTARGKAERDAARRHGVCDVLAKPLDPDDLVRVVRRAIADRS